MINPDQIQAFLEKLEGGVIGVDLIKIGQHHVQQQLNSKNKFNNQLTKFRVALDMEQCLDRFYGGYYSDWACGGQWNRALQFVQLLDAAFKSAQIEVIAFFDGTLKENKRQQLERNDFRQKTLSVLKHIRMIGTPPPKIWWLPPSGVRTALRNALRTVNVQVVQTIHDHTMEVIDYVHDHKLHGLIGLHPDYIVANISRYFSSHDLRLSYKGALETKEFITYQVLNALKLTPDQMAILAVFLGGFILLEEQQLKQVYKRLGVEINSDFEARIRKIADVIRSVPIANLDEFIAKLELDQFAAELKESIEYYQRKGAFGNRRYLGARKKVAEKETKEGASGSTTVAPMASETTETDEIGKKILSEVSTLIDEADEAKEEQKSDDSTPVASTSGAKKSVKFVYQLPAEVIRTAHLRHQRGIMDPRIYTLLTKKEILLPQLLEDEQYREIPSVHLFYRPARQMVYAVLFNLYHQKYMCSKGTKGGKGKAAAAAGADPPEVIINEWIWSPQNEYKRPEPVTALHMQWAVPTVQRLWFGTAFEDKQRRMKAFLTIMRSDTPLMLNRGHVPQHMLVLACVLRYIVANPDRNILTRAELDAFLAAAFSPQLINVDYTQDMVLPSVHLRGVYLATLFMQGVDTAQLANDACGVPLPWSMTNPWLFFDGKIFHLKLKMAMYVTSLRELCDDQLDIVMKIERFRKAILEDIDHFLLPPPHMDNMYQRPNLVMSPSDPPQAPPHYKFAPPSHRPMQNMSGGSAGGYPPMANGYYGPPSVAAPYYNMSRGRNGAPMPPMPPMPKGVGNQGYQLKVGGVVVGSWAGGAPNRGPMGGGARINRQSGQVRLPLGRQRLPLTRSRLSLTGAGGGNAGVTRNVSRNAAAPGKKNNYAKKNKKKGAKAKSNKDEEGDENKENAATTATTAAAVVEEEGEEESKGAGAEAAAAVVPGDESETVSEKQNGTTVLASDIANSVCDTVLKEDDDPPAELLTADDNDVTSKSKLDNGVSSPPVTPAEEEKKLATAAAPETRSSGKKKNKKKGKAETEPPPAATAAATAGKESSGVVE